jgi:3-oxoacyl-[acyl-carrier protein] reductase
VLGGSRGSGQAIAAEPANEDVKVVIVARDPDRTRQAAAEMDELALAGDVSRPGNGHDLVMRAAEMLGQGPDILITNTGGPAPGSFEAITGAS